MKPCSACGRDGDLLQVTSAIDAQSFDVCVTCFEHQAEPVSVVVSGVNSFGWKEIPKQIREAIRVYDLGEYVTVRAWAERMSHRQLEPCRPAPLDEGEEREASEILRKMLAVQDTVLLPSASKKRRTYWLAAMLGFFGLRRELPA